jgi:hypothetical protein
VPARNRHAAAANELGSRSSPCTSPAHDPGPRLLRGSPHRLCLDRGLFRGAVTCTTVRGILRAIPSPGSPFHPAAVASLTDDLELAITPNPRCTTCSCGFAWAARVREVCHLQAEEFGVAGVLGLVNQPPRRYGYSRLEPRRSLSAAIDLPRRGQPL